ncbi:SDR family oxidoreductase [Streptomyces caatingaensis]|uniref:Oxidoreductase n=1 Tax=Streptomyces caatingaensis TaxID=1678637 RepID=A0A0K9XLN7_9ACTN|nr:SDR family oxidoreductase [Streptomyces caatingaensis]KNB54021.1 oxidoreductase [Streptomyces caatingaensis]
MNTQSAHPRRRPLAVVTGAGSGIGAATARALSEEGHPLLLLGRDAARLEALALPDAMTRSVDVTDRAAMDEAVRDAESLYGPVDLLVNNAGVMLLGSVHRQPAEEWDRMLDVNVRGLLNGVRAVLPGMVERRRGTVVNVSSVAGRKSYAHHTVYSGTKFAVHGLSESLREEVSPHGVRVITVAPGAVETGLLSHTTDEAVKAGYQAFKDSVEILTPQDVADAITFAYRLPQRVTLREVVVAATGQAA